MKFEIENHKLIECFVKVANTDYEQVKVAMKATLKIITMVANNIPDIDEAIQAKYLMSEYIALRFYLDELGKAILNAEILEEAVEKLDDIEFSEYYDDLYKNLRRADTDKLNRRERSSYFNKVRELGRLVGIEIKKVKGESDEA